MDDDFKGQKGILRARISARLKAMPADHRAPASRQLCLLLERHSLWKDARTILFFAPMPDEPDIWPLLLDSLAAGKTVALPRFDPTTKRYVACRIADATADLAVGRYGIREPAGHCAVLGLNRLDLTLVPGVAFDLQGRRLGRGKGFYDRLLASVRGATCGIAFDEQIVTEIPVEPHDVHLNCIITPTRRVDVTSVR